jgi:hypothetical protein
MKNRELGEPYSDRKFEFQPEIRLTLFLSDSVFYSDRSEKKMRTMSGKFRKKIHKILGCRSDLSAKIRKNFGFARICPREQEKL